jgi:hypothetical protein
MYRLRKTPVPPFRWPSSAARGHRDQLLALGRLAAPAYQAAAAAFEKANPDIKVKK